MKTILMPDELTAENGAKALFIGEFHENVIMRCDHEGCEDGIVDEQVCESCDGAGDYALRVPIGWDTIKEIYKKAVEHYQPKSGKYAMQSLREKV